MPTIEKLLNTDWKEKFLGKGLQSGINLKGESNGSFRFYIFCTLRRVVHRLRVCVFRNPREPGGEGASVAADDKPAVGSARAAPRRSLRTEEHGCSSPGETAAADGTGQTTAGTGEVNE